MARPTRSAPKWPKIERSPTEVLIMRPVCPTPLPKSPLGWLVAAGWVRSEGACFSDFYSELELGLELLEELLFSDSLEPDELRALSSHPDSVSDAAAAAGKSPSNTSSA